MQQEPLHIDWEKLIDLLEIPADERLVHVSALSAEEQTLFARLQQLKDDPLLTGSLQLNTVQAWARMMEKEKEIPPVRRITYGWKRWIAAASLLFIAGASGWLWMRSHTDRPAQNYQAITQALANHAPSRKVELVTADGNTIEIDSVRQLKEKDGTLIQLQHGSLAYQDGHNNTVATQSDLLLMNTLSVPRGYIYHLALSDGSKVWLNADSRISFPVHFDKAERKVTVEGEAYFEVAHNENWPFIVRAGNTETKVLGTSFDIKAYGRDIYTTLVTGSVLFVPPTAGGVRLKPDEQAMYNGSAGTTETKRVTADDWVAWRNDDLVMIKMSLAELAETLERRYDVQLSFTDEKLKDIQYDGALHFTGNVADMLNSLEQTGNIRFAVKDKKILILPANMKQ